jgi:hypothetical protein
MRAVGLQGVVRGKPAHDQTHPAPCSPTGIASIAETKRLWAARTSVAAAGCVRDGDGAPASGLAGAGGKTNLNGAGQEIP